MELTKQLVENIIAQMRRDAIEFDTYFVSHDTVSLVRNGVVVHQHRVVHQGNYDAHQ